MFLKPVVLNIVEYCDRVDPAFKSILITLKLRIHVSASKPFLLQKFELRVHMQNTSKHTQPS